MAQANLADAFRHLQSGNVAAALAAGDDLVAAQPANSKAHLVRAIALRLAQRLDEARLALSRAAGLDPADAAIAYEAAVVSQLQGDAAAALQAFERAAQLRPGFFAAHFSAGLMRFERGDWQLAAGHFEAALRLEPGHRDVLLNLGQACIESGQRQRGLELLQGAVDRDPRDVTARHILGWALQHGGDVAAALPHFEAAVAADPQQGRWQLSHAQALAQLGRHEEAGPAFMRALSASPEDVATLRAFGRHAASRGEFKRAASLFAEALRLEPGDIDLAHFSAQSDLLCGNFERGWKAYALRDARREFAQRPAVSGHAYSTPTLSSLEGREVLLVAEQGLGDILFFLRYAVLLREHGATLHLAGAPQLHGMLARTGLFESLPSDVESTPAAIPLLVGDAPLLFPDRPYPPSLQLRPDEARVARWRAALGQTGPAPYLGVTWRAGTRTVGTALHKAIEAAVLMGALRGWPGTLIALQRRPEAGEIPLAASAAGASLHDFCAANDDLEDALALVSLLDRHVGVSNTNMHLAAAAGKTAEVLVPFPPEWRWRSEGVSPWFPRFGVYRQQVGGDWSAALAALRTSLGIASLS